MAAKIGRASKSINGKRNGVDTSVGSLKGERCTVVTYNFQSIFLIIITTQR